MSVSIISKRYARALVLLGQERDLVEAFRDQLARLEKAFAAEKRLLLLLQSPSLDNAKKEALLADLATLLQLSREVNSFIGLLQNKDRLRYLSQIIRDFNRLADEVAGVQRVQLRTAAALDKNQHAALKKILSSRSGLHIVLEQQCDAALIGGLQLEMNGLVLDGTVRTQLNRMAETITEGE